MIGIAIGNYIGNQRVRYWTQAKINDSCLFYASHSSDLLSKVAATQLPNQVTGSSDYLTVTGSGLNARYRTPNTADYKTADSDNVFWKTDASESICDGNRLIGYDFPRILVKYLNVSPYTILAIAILKPGVTVTNGMRDAFDLNIWWDNTYSFHGAQKQNKPLAGQYVWTAESVHVLSDTFTDTDGVHLHDHTMNIGPGWTAGNTFTINNNRLVNSGSGGHDYAVVEAGKADVDVSADFIIPANPYFQGSIIFRYQDSGNNWLLYLYATGTNVTVELYKGTGSYASQGSYNAGVLAPGTYPLRVVASGNNIKCYFNGTLRIEVNDATLNTKTKVGLHSWVTGSYVNVPVDNFICD